MVGRLVKADLLAVGPNGLIKEGIASPDYLPGGHGHPDIRTPLLIIAPQ